MEIVIAVLGVLLILTVLVDAFETIVLPRRVTRRFRLTRLFYRSTWRPWSALARRMSHGKRREAYLSFFGPLSLLLLLSVWAAGLVIGFALLYWSIGSPFTVAAGRSALGTDLYFSGTTFFTLGLGDVAPRTGAARVLSVLEAGTGFGLLALVMGYLPVLYQSFSRREVSISLLDSRAGSPPTAAELLRRHSQPGGMEALEELLHDWERWSAELMESHLSYPVLCYFRSQHDNQSWLSALTTILDASALVMVGVDGVSQRQAQLTFAIARHALVDLSQIFSRGPRPAASDRLPQEDLQHLRQVLRAAGLSMRDGPAADASLAELRGLYEPYVNSLATYLSMTTPRWMPEPKAFDNWQTSPWGRMRKLEAAPVTVGDGGHL